QSPVDAHTDTRELYAVYGRDRGNVGGFCFLFFSSRRRHTRFSRDWSSDVCFPISTPGHAPPHRRKPSRPPGVAGPSNCGPLRRRSEERRVGKEGGARKRRRDERGYRGGCPL